MKINTKLTGLALFTGLIIAGPASADVMTGTVYQVADGDVYITMPDTTVARVPLETATFKVDGVATPWNSLQVGQSVVADYTPVYGFQKYYYTDEAAKDGPRTVYLIRDVRPDDISVVEWDGRLYKVKR